MIPLSYERSASALATASSALRQKPTEKITTVYLRDVPVAWSEIVAVFCWNRFLKAKPEALQ
jgi:hypothetical protein